MGHSPFSKPVLLKLHRTGNFQARNAWEACEYLDLHWPGARTARYRQAKALCQSAIDGAVDAETARHCDDCRREDRNRSSPRQCQIAPRYLPYDSGHLAARTRPLRATSGPSDDRVTSCRRST